MFLGRNTQPQLTNDNNYKSTKMNKVTKITLLAILISLAVPTKQFAQSPDRQDANEGVATTTQTVQIRDYENGFLFNVFEIENVEERVQLASALATSDVWICNPTHNPGELFIRPNSFNADMPIYAEFDYLMMTLREEYQEAKIGRASCRERV